MPNNNRADRGANRRRGNDPELTAEQKNIALAKSLGLKPKSRAVLDELLNNPKISQTDAYLKHHKTTNRQTAGSNATQLLKKTSAVVYSQRAVGKATKRIAGLVESNNEGIALKASQDILDREKGKAIQRSESTNRTVEVKLDIGGLRIGSHYMQPTNRQDESEVPES